MLKKITEIKLSKKLQELVDDGTISFERALEYEMDKRSRFIKDHVDKVHPINQLKNGRYYTKLNPQDYKHPMMVNKGKIEDVEEAIYQYYLDKESDKTDKKTFENLYTQWHDDPVGGGKTKPGTMYRTENLYKQFLGNSDLVKIPIMQIDADKFELFFIDCIKQGITKKAFTNVKSLINKVYNYAVKQKLNLPYGHSKDIFKVTEIPMNEFKTTEKRPCELSYNPDEVGIIRKFILDNYALLSNRLQPLAMLGVLFTFFTGVRSGELAALKVADYDAENFTLLIERTETKNQKTNTYTIKPPKTKASNRNIYLSADAREVLILIFLMRGKMGIESEFLFTDRNGKRLNCPRFIKTLEIINNKTSLPYNRSMHDIRRTYASICYLKGVPVQVIQRQLGHETIQQTFEYIKDLITVQEGKMYLEGAVLFAENKETMQFNNIIDFNAALNANSHKKAR